MRRSAYIVGGVALVTVVAGVAVAASASAGTTTYEAEASVNTLAGGATVVDCRRCSGGKRVTAIGGNGSLTVTGVVAEEAGAARLAVTYTSPRARIAQISVNGGIGTAIRFPGTRSENRPATVRVTVTLTAGDNTIAFANPAGTAPDIDKLVLTTDGPPPTPNPTGSATVGPTVQPPVSPPVPDPTATATPGPTPSEPPAPTEPPATTAPPTTRPPADPPGTTRPPATQPPTTRPPNPTPAPTGNAAFEAEVVRLVNVERAAANCPAVADDSRLQAAARGHSADMAARNYFSHNTPEGVEFATRITAAGYQWRGAGENIAKGYRDPAAVMRGWMNSAGHKANILNCGFRDLGVGVAADASGTLQWTQDFGSQR